MLAFAQSPEILNQAKKEGEVILYTTMTVRDFEFFSKAAKESILFSISATSISAQGGRWRA